MKKIIIITCTSNSRQYTYTYKFDSEKVNQGQAVENALKTLLEEKNIDADNSSINNIWVF